jgi:hypothetical protein
MFLARPLPIYQADAPIAQLQPAELFVICLARLWVLHYRNPDAMLAEWRAGFAHMHIDREGEIGFDALLALVASSAVRGIDIRCKRCPHLGGDEAWLLQLVGLLQRDRLAEAVAILAERLPAGAVRQAIGPAQSFAAGLAACGLAIPLRRTEGTELRVVTAHGCTSSQLH